MSEPQTETGSGTAPRALAAGFGRLIVLVYVVFAVSAGARALFQVVTKFGEAPVSFTLSAVAAVIYLVAAIAIIRGAARLALLAVGIELAGVLAVGGLSFAVPHWFPEPSVWSHFGSGYGYVPLVLPVVGVVYLLKRRTRSSESP